LFPYRSDVIRRRAAAAADDRRTALKPLLRVTRVRRGLHLVG
jgi:hypothetical protein